MIDLVRSSFKSCVFGLLCLVAGCITITQPASTTSDYRNELFKSRRLQAQYERTGETLKAMRQAFIIASLTADLDEISELLGKVQEVIEIFGPLDDLILAKSSLQIKLHKPLEARKTLESVPGLSSSPRATLLQATIALQLGRYDAALSGLKAATETQPRWESLSQLAHYLSMTGHEEEADKLYEEAQHLVTAKEMRHYAWLEMQRGVIDLHAGRFEQALRHYNHSDHAYSGYWLIQEHLAEVLGKLGQTEDATMVYDQVVETTEKPELIGAYGMLLAASDQKRSDELLHKAHVLFERQMELYPEAVAGHYLKFLLATGKEPGRLIELAQIYFEAQPNTEAKSWMAKAYRQAGNEHKARVLEEEVKASPWKLPVW